MTQKKLVIVDDSLVVRFAWRAKNQKNFSITLIDSPEAFFQTFSTPQLLQEVSIVVCDYHFDNSTQNGAEVVQYIKKFAPNVKVYLSSFANLNIDIEGLDGVLDKDAVDLSQS